MERQVIENLMRAHYPTIIGNKGISNIEKFTSGWVNHNYLVQFDDSHESPDVVVLRLIRLGNGGSSDADESYENLLFEVRVLLTLKEHGFNVPVPIQSSSGYVNRLDESLYGYHFAILFEFASGVHKTSDRQEWETVQIAEFLGRLHQVSNTMVQNGKWKREDIPEDRWNPLIVLNELRTELNVQYERHLQETMDPLIMATKDLATFFKSNFDHVFPVSDDTTNEAILNSNILPIGLVHSDLHDENVLVNVKEQRLECVLDWNELWIGPHIVDVAQCLFFWCLNNNQTDLLGRKFVQTYESVRGYPLLLDEKTALRGWFYVTCYYLILFLLEDCPIDSDKSILRLQYLTEHQNLLSLLKDMNNREFLAYFGIEL